MPIKSTYTKRIWEIDTFRGFAIILMIFYHIIFDLSFLRITSSEIYHNLSRTFPYLIGGMFIFIVGISLTLSYSAVEQKLTIRQCQKKFLLRGTKIFLLGLLITCITLFYIPKGAIYFGVLHCIGLSIILAYPFISRYRFSIPLGLLIIFLGMFFRLFTVSYPWLLWLGIRPDVFYTLDYYPLFPWLGIMLFGIYVGRVIYPKGTRVFTLPDLSKKIPISSLKYLGQHSLLIYFLHQPIIIGILSILLLL